MVEFKLQFLIRNWFPAQSVLTISTSPDYIGQMEMTNMKLLLLHKLLRELQCHNAQK